VAGFEVTTDMSPRVGGQMTNFRTADRSLGLFARYRSVNWKLKELALCFVRFDGPTFSRARSLALQLVAASACGLQILQYRRLQFYLKRSMSSS
jgi:hypothetical protein